MSSAASRDIQAYAVSRGDRLVQITRDLVGMRSENRAPNGNEQECQNYIAAFLGRCGFEVRSYTPDEVPGIQEHPLYWPGREYRDRPNVAGRSAGTGSGRSLVLSGHIDTVPIGAAPWAYDPLGGEVDGNRLYGRGANDMKAGVAMNLFVAEALHELGVKLEGDLTVESVVDEEFGGVNGTLAGRLMGYTAHAAVITEPSFLRICAAQRGGRTAHITLYAPNAGILGGWSAGVIEQLRLLLDNLNVFERMRRDSAAVHPMYAHAKDPVPVAITRVFTAAWGTSEATNTPETCRIELFWQAMPGERCEDVDAAFWSWFRGVIAAHPRVFLRQPDVVFPIRWLPGSAIPPDAAVVRELSEAVQLATGRTPLIQGIEGPCDMYVFHEFGIPAVLWGPRGGNTHNPDEYVEIDSLIDAGSALLEFVCQWCGVRS